MKSAPALRAISDARSFSSKLSRQVSRMTFTIAPPPCASSTTPLMSWRTISKCSLVPDFSRPMFRTMSTSCAPSFTTRAVSSRLEAERVAPKGNPTTTPVLIPVPANASTAVATQKGFTIAQAKPYSAASWQSWITCARVASGFRSVWSSTAASAEAEERACAEKADASKVASSVFILLLLG